jgi:hypothetical protein
VQVSKWVTDLCLWNKQATQTDLLGWNKQVKILCDWNDKTISVNSNTKRCLDENQNLKNCFWVCKVGEQKCWWTKYFCCDEVNLWMSKIAKWKLCVAGPKNNYWLDKLVMNVWTTWQTSCVWRVNEQSKNKLLNGNKQVKDLCDWRQRVILDCTSEWLRCSCVFRQTSKPNWFGELKPTKPFWMDEANCRKQFCVWTTGQIIFVAKQQPDRKQFALLKTQSENFDWVKPKQNCWLDNVTTEWCDEQFGVWTTWQTSCVWKTNKWLKHTCWTESPNKNFWWTETQSEISIKAKLEKYFLVLQRCRVNEKIFLWRSKFVFGENDWVTKTQKVFFDCTRRWPMPVINCLMFGRLDKHLCLKNRWPTQDNLLCWKHQVKTLGDWNPKNNFQWTKWIVVNSFGFDWLDNQVLTRASTSNRTMCGVEFAK